MEYELIISEDHRMTGIGTTLISSDDVSTVGQNIYDFALTFIAPLRTHNDHASTMRTKHWHVTYQNSDKKREPHGISVGVSGALS